MLATGDYEEHAILLCNYILALGMPAWVVIGKAIPEGESAYVLANYDNEFWLWNAIKAECYNVNSFFCPMLSVSSRLHEHWIPLHYDRSGLSSERIIYGPTSSLTSRRIRFHLISPSQLVSKYLLTVSIVTASIVWQPFFSKSFPRPHLNTIQIDNLLYTPADLERTLELQVSGWMFLRLCPFIAGRH